MNMKRLGLWFYLLCKRQLKNGLLTFFLLAMPAAALIFHRLPAMEEGGIPQIALFAVDNDPVAQGAMETLLSKTEGIRFYASPSQEQLKADIIEGKADCGYIFKESLSARLEGYQQKDSVLLVKNKESIVTSATNEMVVSAIIKNYSREITLSFMKKQNLLDDSDSNRAYFDRQFSQHLENGSSLLLQFETLEQEDGVFVTRTIETKAMTLPLRGIIAVLIYIACIFGAIQWLMDKEHSLFAAMERSFCRISKPLYILVPAVFFSVSGLASIYLSGTGENFFKEIFVLLLYMLLNVAMGTLFTVLFKKSRTLTALLPVVILCSLLLCPVFLDLSFYFPVIKSLRRLFLPYYYLRFF